MAAACIIALSCGQHTPHDHRYQQQDMSAVSPLQHQGFAAARHLCSGIAGQCRSLLCALPTDSLTSLRMCSSWCETSSVTLVRVIALWRLLYAKAARQYVTLANMASSVGSCEEGRGASPARVRRPNVTCTQSVITSRFTTGAGHVLVMLSRRQALRPEQPLLACLQWHHE